MKKVLLIALALVALFAFVSCSEITPAGTYTAKESLADGKITVTAKLVLATNGEAKLESVSAKANDDSALAKAAETAANAILSGAKTDLGKWEHDGKKVTIAGVDAEYNGTSLKYKVADGYTLTFKR